MMSSPVAAGPTADAPVRPKSQDEGKTDTKFASVLGDGRTTSRDKTDREVPTDDRAAGDEEAAPANDWPMRLEALIARRRLEGDAEGSAVAKGGTPSEVDGIAPTASHAVKHPVSEALHAASPDEAADQIDQDVKSTSNRSPSVDAISSAQVDQGASMGADRQAAQFGTALNGSDQQRRPGTPSSIKPQERPMASGLADGAAAIEGQDTREATRVESLSAQLRTGREEAGDRRLPPQAGAAVISASTTPAPQAGLQNLLSPSALIATEIEADRTIRTAAREISEGQQPARSQPLQVLKIQLNPAELGSVTARLSLVGTEMTVDLSVETAEARQRLQSDSEQIVKTLRGLGFEVERINVQHNLGASSSANQSGQDARNHDGRGAGNAFSQEGNREGNGARNGQDGNGRNTAVASSGSRDDGDHNGVYI